MSHEERPQDPQERQEPQDEMTINCSLYAPIPRGNRVRVYIFIKPGLFGLFSDSVNEDEPLLHDLDADVYYGKSWHLTNWTSRTTIDPELRVVRQFEGHVVQAFVMYSGGKHSHVLTALTLRVASSSEEHTDLTRSTSDSVTSPIAFDHSEGSSGSLSAQAPMILPKERSTELPKELPKELSKESTEAKPSDSLIKGKEAPAFKFAWLFMAVAFIYLAAVLFNTMQYQYADESSQSERQSEVEKRSTPSGLKGLRFGMSRAEAERVIPGVASARFTLPDKISAGGRSANRPGFNLTIKTLIMGLSAECVLEFATQETLSKMTCVINLQGRQAHLAAEEQLLKTLTSKYGDPSGGEPRTTDFGSLYTHEGSWRWRDAHAKLDLSSVYKDSFGNRESAITLTNTSRDHEKLIDQIEEELSSHVRAREAEQRRSDQAERERLMKIIRKNQANADDDL